MVHPPLDEIGGPRTDSPKELSESRKSRARLMDAGGVDRNVQSRDLLGHSAMALERHHGGFEPRAIERRQQLLQASFGSPNIQSGDDVPVMT